MIYDIHMEIPLWAVAVFLGIFGLLIIAVAVGLILEARNRR